MCTAGPIFAQTFGRPPHHALEFHLDLLLKQQQQFLPQSPHPQPVVPPVAACSDLAASAFSISGSSRSGGSRSRSGSCSLSQTQPQDAPLGKTGTSLFPQLWPDQPSLFTSDAR